MRHTNIALALLTAAALTACGGNGSSGGDQTLKTKFSAEVVFGDSLADTGSYAVGPIAAAGGGRFTINAPDAKMWPEYMAAQLGLPAPCSAQTGLVGQGPFNVAVVNHPNCFNYAQGGARVTIPVGPGNPLTGPTGFAMTVPVVTQVANFLAASGGKFSGTEVVMIMAGGNDALTQLGQLEAAATAAGTAAGQQTFATTLTGLLAAGATNPQTAAQAIGGAILAESAKPTHTDQSVVAAAVGAAAVQPGNSAVANPAVYGPMVATAQAAATTAGQKAGADYAAAHGPDAVKAMAQAGGELAALVKTQIIGKGANYVVVNNLPDVSISPSAKKESADIQALVKAMASAFNTALSAGLAGDPKVLYVDLFTNSDDQVANPAPYGLTNITTAACNNPEGSSIFCTSKTVVAGDVSHYLFADGVHPSPYEHSLIARLIAEQMILKGWL
jgi:phospholipase/lecithinase/hemolysin